MCRVYSLFVVSHSQKELDAAEKVILFAPPGDDGRDRMLKLLRDHGIGGRWVLQPIRNKNHDLKSSQLSHILQEALRIQRRHTRQDGPVVFLGMDSPEVPLNELVAACFQTGPNEALLCPAADGGYGLLSVPSSANPRSCFANVQWSHPLTALSQMKALTDQGLAVTLGPIMHDIDDGDDMEQLCRRLSSGPASLNSDSATVLSQPSLPARLHHKRRASAAAEADDHQTMHGCDATQAYSCGSSDPSSTSWFTIPITPSPKKGNNGALATASCKYTRRALTKLKQLEEPVATPKSRGGSFADGHPGLGSGAATYPSCGEGPAIGSTLLEDLKAVWSFS